MPGLVQGKPMPGVGLFLEVLDQQCAWTSTGKPMPGVGLSLEVLDQQCACTSPGTLLIQDFQDSPLLALASPVLVQAHC